MDTTFAMPSQQNPTKVKLAKQARPKVHFMSPKQLAPYKEQVWAINAALVDWSRAEFDKSFDATPLYAVFFVNGEVVGLTTVMEQTFEVNGRSVFTIGLGRAVVHPDFRNQFLVQRALIFRWMRRFLQRPWQPIYIWGSCVSYKSYLSFVRVLKVVYPVANVVTPSKHEAAMDCIGKFWYSDEYNLETKTVRVPNFKVSDSSTIPQEADLADRDIQFYAASVPNEDLSTYGLLTISPCIRSNFIPMIGSWMRNFLRKSLGLRRPTKR